MISRICQLIKQGILTKYNLYLCNRIGFKNFYISRAKKTLSDKSKHPTLGGAWENDAKQLQNREMIFKFLVEQGLKKSDKLVDYGCGSLRIGSKLIEFLDPGRYIGFDITDRFYKLGLNTVKQETVTTKSPEFYVISDSAILNCKKSLPAYIISIGVLMHIPPNELKEFFANIISLLSPSGVAYITYKQSSVTQKTNLTSWVHSYSLVNATVEELGGQIELHSHLSGVHSFLKLKLRP